MKKILLLLSLVCTLLLAGTAMAYDPYPNHLGGDDNYILVDGHMGVAWYLDRSSLYVEKYEPPQYIIAVNVCQVNGADRGNTAISRVLTERFFYNWDLRQMYVDRDGSSNWRYLDSNGSWAATGIVMPAGEMAFYLAYDMRFYGCFDSEFYQRS
ncbi:hypothetical protein [uncultured Megasphaera sp.]|uniref:hypothetical protein n=1 Tax=uncultured Megasphaera sp. TaxID=165188 RepID=UPI00262220D6|nr:hypothetical protein [uncultured Megasphaera sp.]